MKHNFSNIGEINTNLYTDTNLNVPAIFTTLFKSIPNEAELICKLNLKEAQKYIKYAYNPQNDMSLVRKFEYTHRQIKLKNLNRFLLKKTPVKKKADFLFLLKEGLMLVLQKSKYKIYYDERIPENEIQSLESELQSFIRKKKKRKTYFYMIVSGITGLDLQKFNTKKHEIDINLNYNDDFGDFDKSVRKFLKTKSKSGIILMHGISGSGKTTYIRHLINEVNKKFIFLPAYMAETLASPDFLPFLTEQKKSVLIIEDAEKLIISRQGNGSNNGIATLLNMSDGLLSDALGIKIICTFNTGIESIDKALLRKGRMINKYEFKELSIEKANIIAQKYNLNYNGNKPITLGDLYNINDENMSGKQEIQQIGFIK